MNLLTICFTSIIHIILVLIFEGILLFVILLPLINRFVSNAVKESNTTIYDKMHPESKNKYIEMWIWDSKTNSWKYNPEYLKKQNRYWIWDNEKQSWIVNPEYNKLQTIFTPTETTILRSGVIDETIFLNTQKYKPYIIYSILCLSLVIIFVILLIISKKYSIEIDYKFSIINSIIVFILIGGYAGALLWYSVFTQPYVVNINKNIFQILLDTWNSA